MTSGPPPGARERWERARTFLFVPGDRPDRFASAEANGADAVVLDLEDAVAAGAKSDARRHVIDHIRTRDAGSGPVVAVRISTPSSSAGAADLAALHGLPPEVAVMVAKADRAALEAAHAALPASPLIPLVETARGVEELRDTVRIPQVLRLVFGHLDLSAELGVDPDDTEVLGPVRLALRTASASAGLAAPVDGVTVDFRDADRIRADVGAARRYGFAGKLCIHPRQIGAVHDALRPSEAETEWARRVLGAGEDGGVVSLDGMMVDRPVVLRAQSILTRGEVA